MEKWQLPSGWEWIPVNRVASDTSRRDPRQAPLTTFRYVEIGAVDTETGVIVLDKVRRVEGKDAPSRARKVIKADDLLYATTRPYLRNIARVPEVLDGEICSTGFCVLRPRYEAIIPRYLFWACRSQFFVSQLIPKQRGASYPAVTDGDVFETEIPIPYPDQPSRSLNVQRDLVARIETLIAELRAMQELNQKISADTRLLLDATLADIFQPSAMHRWEFESPLEKVVEINAPLVDPTSPEHRNLPHIYGRVVEEGTGQLLDYNTAAEDGMRSSKYFFSAGAILYSKIRPYLRKATLVDFDGLCSADMYPLRVKHEAVVPEFLMWVLLSPDFTNYANSLSARARIPKLNRQQLFAYQLHFPLRRTQERIAFHLTQVRSEIMDMRELSENDTSLLEQMEQSILMRAFQGEL